MNRILKFRTWCKISEHFTDIPFLSSSGGQILWHHTGNEISITNLDEGNHVVQQFTGLKDKNDREIYEGDMLHWTHPMKDIGEVRYFISEDFSAPHPNQCYFGLNVKRLGICHFQSDDEYEIIGNIFENRELLKT